MTDQEVPKGHVAIRAIRFWEEYKTSASGEIQAEDWVEYCSPGQAAFTTIEDAVRRVQRDKSGKWASIEPAYKAWKQGIEIPVDGTPLGAWNGCSVKQAEILKANGVRTVEEVAAMTDTLLTRIKLPNPRALKDQAGRFLEARSGHAVEEAIKARDEEIADLKAKMDDLMGLIGGADEPRNRGGRPRKDQPQAAA